MLVQAANVRQLATTPHRVMAWRCAKCSRHWGRRWESCPLCREIFEKKLCLLKLAPRRLPFIVRNMLGRFLGTSLPAPPLPKRSLCREGTALNCRCARCRHVDTRIVLHLAEKSWPGQSRCCTLGACSGASCWSCTQRLAQRAGRLAAVTRLQPWEFQRLPCERGEVLGLPWWRP